MTQNERESEEENVENADVVEEEEDDLVSLFNGISTLFRLFNAKAPTFMHYPFFNVSYAMDLYNYHIDHSTDDGCFDHIFTNCMGEIRERKI